MLRLLDSTMFSCELPKCVRLCSLLSLTGFAQLPEAGVLGAPVRRAVTAVWKRAHAMILRLRLVATIALESRNKRAIHRAAVSHLKTVTPSCFLCRRHTSHLREGGWSGWTMCNNSCDGWQYRMCNNPPPINGGQSCLGVNIQVCASTPCPSNDKRLNWPLSGSVSVCVRDRCPAIDSAQH